MKAELSEHVLGGVYAPDDAGYTSELAGFNAAIEHTPDLVVAAASAADVVAAVRFARARRLRVSVQATGHGAHAPIAGGLVVSTRRLDRVMVDPATRIATIGAGARWGAVIAAAAAHGLAPIAGSSSTVGAVGYLLGGGLGPLARSHGVSSDYLAGATVVTGTGEPIDAEVSQNPDLFWALRGGKYGLGVVTEARVRLVPLRTLYAGALFFAEEQIETALRAWVAWSAGADARVTTSVAIIAFPVLEQVPPPFRGRRLLALRFAYPGPLAEGERLAAPLRAAAPLYLDALGALPAAEVARIHNDPTEPTPAWVTGLLLARADDDLVTALLAEVGPGAQSPFVAAELRHLGGAVAQDVPGGSAVAGRSAAYTFGAVSVDPALFPKVLPAVSERIEAALAPWRAGEGNVHFSPPNRAAAAIWPPALHERLLAVRRRYDPDGVFT